MTVQVPVPGGPQVQVPGSVPGPMPVPGVQPMPVPVSVAPGGVDTDALATAMLGVSLNGPPSGGVAAADEGLGVLPGSLPAGVEAE